MQTREVDLKARTILLLGLLLIASQIASADEWYRWVDSEGRAIISRKPPPSGAHKQYRATPSQREGQSTVLKRSGRSRTTQVELYTTSWCRRCDEARAYLQQRGIPFREYDVEKDPEADRRRKALDSRSGVPLAVINGRKILGFSPGAYQQALGVTP